MFTHADISPDGRYLYYSKDVTPGLTFEYNKDPNGTIYAIMRRDLTTGRERRAVSIQGGSVTPQVRGGASIVYRELRHRGAQSHPKPRHRGRRVNRQEASSPVAATALCYREGCDWCRQPARTLR